MRCKMYKYYKETPAFARKQNTTTRDEYRINHNGRWEKFISNSVTQITTGHEKFKFPEWVLCEDPGFDNVENIDFDDTEAKVFVSR